jgi:hypothetical protein
MRSDTVLQPRREDNNAVVCWLDSYVRAGQWARIGKEDAAGRGGSLQIDHSRHRGVRVDMGAVKIVQAVDTGP